VEIKIQTLQNVERGPVAILGRGPDLNNWKGKKFSVPIIGINTTWKAFPDQEYYVTVAYESITHFNVGDVKIVKKAVFSTSEKRKGFRPTKFPVAFADMSLTDDYSHQYKRRCVFDPDLSKPTRATFGGLYAIQCALFLGYNPIYLVGFWGGGMRHFDKPGIGYIPVDYHQRCHWHVQEWLKSHPEIMIYQTCKDAPLTGYKHGVVPHRERKANTSWLSMS
jgi:hypothetical protein